MSKHLKIALVCLGLGALLLLPAVLGSVIYVLGMGPTAAMCTPNVGFWATCIKGTYFLLSTATGGIMWVSAIVIAAIGYLIKLSRSK